MWLDFLQPPPKEEELAEARLYGEQVISSSPDGTVVGYLYKGAVYVTSVDIVPES